MVDGCSVSKNSLYALKQGFTLHFVTQFHLPSLWALEMKKTCIPLSSLCPGDCVLRDMRLTHLNKAGLALMPRTTELPKASGILIR